MAARKRVFEGVKVADFGWVATAPCSVRHLVEHGAECIRVESVTRPDTCRMGSMTKNYEVDMNENMMYNMYSPGRYSLAVNLKDPRGLDIAKKVIAWADIMVENMTPGSMGRLGLGYEDAKKVNPGIIYFAISVMGEDGPLKGSTGYGSLFQGPTGLNHLWGWPDRLPVGSPIPYTDFFNFHMVGFGLMAALDYKRRTGKGQLVEFSQVECTLHQIAPALLDYTTNNRVEARMGNRHQVASPHGVFPAKGKDLWVAIAVFNDAEWQAFCDVIGKPEWRGDPLFSTFAARKQHEDELEKHIGEWTINYDRYEIMDKMQAAGVPAAVVQSGKDLYYDPQLKARKFYWRLNHPAVGPMNGEAHAYHLTKTPIEVKRAPLIGEHNEMVCKKILSMPDTQYNELVAAKVIEQCPGTLKLLEKMKK